MIVRLTPEAEEDLREARRWYAAQGVPGLDDDFGRALEHTLERLKSHPRLYRELHGTTRRAFMSRFPYGVYYLVEEEAVVVVGLRHFAREPLEENEGK